MAWSALESRPFLEVRVSSSGGKTSTEYAFKDGGDVFKKVEQSAFDHLTTSAVWKSVSSNWAERDAVVERVGHSLAQWLFSETVAQRLTDAVKKADQTAPLRLEIRAPDHLDLPWEAMALKGIGGLSHHQHMTLVRVSDQGYQRRQGLRGQLRLDLTGVRYDKAQSLASLATGPEIERIRLAVAKIEGAPFTVRTDSEGLWSTLVERYGSGGIGPPDVFHFAGHGLDDGSGLYFQGAHGGAKEINAGAIAGLLANSRQTRLAFLNACSTSANGPSELQPFGGLSARLIAQGIPMVVGLQTPISDEEAIALATEFYSRLASGDGVDCAVQWARRALYIQEGGSSIAWAFLSLHISGEPTPLRLSESVRPGEVDVTELVKSFGHREQRARLEAFLSRRQPTVIVVPGESRSGHRHVIERIVNDLQRSGRAMAYPVTELRINLSAAPNVQRQALAGAIAQALSIPHTGEQADVENRISIRLAELAQDRILVIDIVSVIRLANDDQAKALSTLLLRLWVQLMELATPMVGDELAVFLLVGIAYPRAFGEGDPRARLASMQRDITNAVIEELKANKRTGRRTRLEVLEPLMQFDVEYLQEFLEISVNLDEETAKSVAQNIVGTNDNETIIDELENYLTSMDRI
jgi:hypothetical protein